MSWECAVGECEESAAASLEEMNPERGGTVRKPRLAVAVAAAALASAGVVGAIAHATTPGQNGLIAFTRYRLQDAPLRSEIYVANPDGSGERAVSSSRKPVLDNRAQWSPNGRWIVFQRCTETGPCSIWLVKSDGTSQHRVTAPCPADKPPPACPDDSQPSFAPDGRHIAYVHEWGPIRSTPVGDQIEHSAIVLVDFSGTHMQVLRRLDGFRGSIQAPRISADGTRVAFYQDNSNRLRPRGGRAIFVMRIDGTGLRRLTPWTLRAANPAWSSDSETILFRSTKPTGSLSPGTNLFTVGGDGEHLQQVTHIPEANYVSEGSYSPDGSSIVFATDVRATPNPRGGTFADIYTAMLGSDTFTAVTRTANLELNPAWGRAEASG